MPLGQMCQHASWGMAVMRAKDDKLVMMNRSFARMHHSKKGDLIGKPFSTTLAPEVQPSLPHYCRLADDRGHSVYESVHIRKDGKTFPAITHLSAVRGLQGKVEYRAVMILNISDRKRAEELQNRRLQNLREQLQERALAVRQVTGRLLRAQDDEHRRIARELHDSVGQYLTALKMDLQRLAGLQSHSDSEETKKAECLSECLHLADVCLNEIRTLSHLLHPPLLDEVGFISAARWYIDGFAKRSSIRVNCTLPTGNPRFPECVELVLFRTLQESLTNAYRHSGSKTINISFITGPDCVTLRICDQGRGMNPRIVKQFQEHGTGVGIGLAGIRERLTELAGHLNLQSDARGTEVSATIPLAQRVILSSSYDVRKAAAV